MQRKKIENNTLIAIRKHDHKTLIKNEFRVNSKLAYEAPINV